MLSFWPAHKHLSDRADAWIIVHGANAGHRGKEKNYILKKKTGRSAITKHHQLKKKINEAVQLAPRVTLTFQSLPY